MKSLVLSTSSNETTKYSDSLRNLGLGEVELIAYDPVDRSEQTMYDMTKESAPDFIVYIGTRWGKQPSIATLAKINSTIAPMIHLCSDAADFPWHDLLREYHEKGAFTLQVAIDGSPKWPGASSGLTLLTPVDPVTFPDIPQPHSVRGVHCGFAGNGGSGQGSQRTAILSGLLKQKAIGLRIRSDLPHTYESYCDYLASCRLSLNIAYSGTEQALQVKGRVIESALACACLLETKGAPTSEWFKPGEDYFEYGSIEEAAGIIKRLMFEPEQSEMMATRLRNKVLANHTPKHFWNAILDRIGFKEVA